MSYVSEKMTGTSEELPSQNASDLTASQILQEISLIPQRLLDIRKRVEQVGTLSTSEEQIKSKKCVVKVSKLNKV